MDYITMTNLDSHSGTFAFSWSNPVKRSTGGLCRTNALFGQDSVVVVCFLIFFFFFLCVCFFCPSSPLKLIGGSVCQHFQACMGHTFLGGSSSMHASDDHEGVGRIPERAKRRLVKAVRATKNGQWGIQRLIYI